MLTGTHGAVRSLALAAAFILSAQLRGQDAGPQVSLGFAAGPPGKQVTIPLVLRNATGKNIWRVVSTVRFPAAYLTFVRLERAALLNEEQFEGVGELLKSKPGKGSKKPATTVLEVRIAARDGRTTLEDGTIGYLVFRIQAATNPDNVPEIELQNAAQIFVSRAPGAAPVLSAEKSALIVEKPGAPVIACFFYMH